MSYLKKVIFNGLAACGTDGIMRWLNRKKLLVVMYHGVTRNTYDPPIWTQLPEKKFIEQVRFIKSNYNVLSLSDLVSCICAGVRIPERSALITFDDGLKNNYSVAFPILKGLGIPAAVFLTMDFINTERVLWFDELLFIVKERVKNGETFDRVGIDDVRYLKKDDVWGIYFHLVNKMKHMAERERKLLMEQMREGTDINSDRLLDDFGMLTWEHVLEMERSGVFDFGTHTANHRILTNLDKSEWESELNVPRKRLSEILEKDVLSFCYPNGVPEQDFNEEHIQYLKKCGYKCAFTTKASLYELDKNEPFRIGRIPAGNDFTSYNSYFRLKSSGFLDRA